MPETRCESKELLLLVSMCECTCVYMHAGVHMCLCALQVALHVVLELRDQLLGDGEGGWWGVEEQQSQEKRWKSIQPSRDEFVGSLSRV